MAGSACMGFAMQTNKLTPAKALKCKRLNHLAMCIGHVMPELVHKNWYSPALVTDAHPSLLDKRKRHQLIERRISYAHSIANRITVQSLGNILPTDSATKLANVLFLWDMANYLPPRAPPL